MEGFFSKKEVQSTSRIGGKSLTCTACGLYKNCKSPKMPPYGNFKKKILIIGSAPGQREDTAGIPWRGKAGNLLNQTLQKLGISLEEDCLSIYACHCRPTKNEEDRDPSEYEISACRKTTLKIIEERKPLLIITLGRSATFSLIGHRWIRDFGEIEKWRGWRIPDQDLQCWVCPTYDPDFIVKEDTKQSELIWTKDLQEAITLITPTKWVFPKYREPEIEVISDLRPLLNLYNCISAFDYETTGIKPHAPGHRIVCASVADTRDHAFVFMMPETRQERLPFISYLVNSSIKKIAHNMKFEDQWSNVRLRTNVEGWYFDTMLASHILDNRPKITGLKFQVYVQFGIIDYESEVSPFLKSTNSKDANAMNKILELITSEKGKQQLMKYCAYDSINEYRLADYQLNIMEPLPF